MATGEDSKANRDTTANAGDLENVSNGEIANTYIPDDLRYKISKEMKKEIAERSDKGETQEEIARDYGITRRRVSQIIKKKEE